jgi:hypothetical protein
MLINLLFPGRSHSKYTFSELISMLQAGGVAREKALGYLMQRFTPLYGALKKKFLLSTDEIDTAYSSALTAVDIYVREKWVGDPEALPALVEKIFQRKCIDVLRKRTSLSFMYNTADSGILFP